MKRMLIELIENNSYKNKFELETYSVLAKKKQGIVVSKRR